MSEEDGRIKAIKAMAEYLYDCNASRAAPRFDQAPEMVQHMNLEAAAVVVKIVYDAAVPASPDLQVAKLRIEMLAEEVEQTRKIDAAGMARVLRGLLRDL